MLIVKKDDTINLDRCSGFSKMIEKGSKFFIQFRISFFNPEDADIERAYFQFESESEMDLAYEKILLCYEENERVCDVT